VNGLIALFSDYTLQTVLVGSIILGVTSGILGSFALLRQQSLLGDAIAHATLPGVGLAFLLTQEKSPLVLLIGAGLAGWLGTILVKVITENTRIKRDAALGITLSVFFGLGLVILTIAQKLPNATKAGLDKFLFGNAATLLRSDVTTMIWLSAMIFGVLALCWKEFKLIVFDQDFAKSLGLRVQAFDITLTTLIVMTIVIGLQTVGVVLMSAMIVAPAAAARQWTDRLGAMVVIAAFFGAVCGAAGSVTSSLVLNLPTGPTIVVYLSAVVIVSLLLAPNRGLLWDYLRAARSRRRIMTTSMLKNLLLFSEIHTDPFHPHDIAALQAVGRAAIEKTMAELKAKGWAQQFSDKRWALTPMGLFEAKKLTEDFEGEINVTTSN
jgi:manganese/zinc/iron transport system permease protein